jgi:mannonate dehydratase
MKRRSFLSTGAAAAALSCSSPASASAAVPKRALMKLGATVSGGAGLLPSTGAEGGARGRGAENAAGRGTEGAAAAGRGPGPSGIAGRGGNSAPRDPEAGWKSLGRWGIRNVVATAQLTDRARLYPTVDELKQLTDKADQYGISVDVLNPPSLGSSNIDSERNAAIMLGESPQRDRDIEQIQTMIRNCAAAKIPCIKYNMSILGVLRTGRIQGRGDTSYSSFKLADVKPSKPLTRAGVVDADKYWERITYFLERVIPVANEFKVRMACHPNDSMTPPEGYMGVNAVLSTVEGLKKFVSIKESPYHGLNFCQGTVSEMLQKPGVEIYDVIRYFGSRKKIFNVHFRNIKGNRTEFAEVAPDEGDVDMFKAMQVFKDVGYAYMVQPDHSVSSPSDSGGEYTAFVYGYIRALIQAVDRA